MARVPGIQIEKDSKGVPAYARIDLKKHGEALKPFLDEVGANEKDEFDIAFENGLSPEEFKSEMKIFIHEMFKTPPTGIL